MYALYMGTDDQPVETGLNPSALMQVARTKAADWRNEPSAFPIEVKRIGDKMPLLVIHQRDR